MSRSSVLRMSKIKKSFAGVHALKGVDFDLELGECHGVCGENGAGKSTLIKVLGGAHMADSGDIFLDEAKISITDPVNSQHQGIAIIYQEFNLIPEMSVAENIFLGRELLSKGLVDHKAQHEKAVELFKRIGLEINPSELCRDLTVAQQQTVEIAKALSINARIIVMDEPSAALTNQEVTALFNIIKDLKRKGISIIYISHRLDEIFEICDRVTVMRDGEYIGTEKVKDINKERLIEMMVGRSLENEFPKQKAPLREEVLRVEHLNRADAVKDVSFKIRGGEVLGFSGLVGAGRTETMRIIFGADHKDNGEIYIRGNKVEINSPRKALEHRICLLTEDRKGQGLILVHSVRENFGLPNLDTFAPKLFVNSRKEREALAKFVTSLQIKIPHQEELAANLSGGNQQKVVLAKWLQKNCDIIIFDEPTRGIDVGAKYEIYLLINHLASEGKAIIMVSSELPEILGMSDRIIVMHEGSIKGEITNVAHATQEQILTLAIT